MTVPTTTIRNGPYYPNGATAAFPFTFRALDKTDVQVIRVAANGAVTLLSEALFNVTLTENGGSANFAIAPAAGDPLYVQMDPTFEQEISLENEGAFLPEVITEALDRGAQRSLVLRDMLSRTFLTPPGDLGFQLPVAASRASKFLAFGADGSPFMSAGTGADAGLRTDLATVGASLSFFRDVGTGAIAATVDAALKRQPLSPFSFGAKWDGVTDDAAAIQRCIDEADIQGRPIALPVGTAIVKAPLRTYGKMLVMIGTPGRTIIKAGIVMRCVIDDVAATDSYYNPLWISGLVLDGGSLVTEACISLRFRHHVVLDTILSQFPAPTATNFRARDCWLGRYYNLRTLEGSIGFHAMGANHASTWDSCDFNAVRDCHVLIDNQADAGDGNHGLIFMGCSTEFSMPGYTATGTRLMPNTSAHWTGGYIGENVTGPVIDNRGGLFTVDGTIYFAGYTLNSVLVRPFAGRTLIRNGRVADQNTGGGSGIVALMVNVEDANAAAATGKVLFDNVDIYTPLGGGTRTMNGDFLDYGLVGNNLARSVGRSYQDAAFGGQTYTMAVANGDKTLTATNSTASIMALYGAFYRDDYMIAKPVYIAITYKSSQPLVLASVNGLGGAPAPTIDTLPATGGLWKTFVNVLSNMEAGATGLQLYMPNPATGAVMGLRSVSMSDARISQGSLNGGPVRLGHF